MSDSDFDFDFDFVKVIASSEIAPGQGLQVEVEKYHSKPVTVLGEVARPGTYYLEGQTSLHKILAEAGGLKTSAGQFVELRRLHDVDGVELPFVRTFGTSSLLKGEEGRDIILQQGDVISVSAKQQFFITGEVNTGKSAAGAIVARDFVCRCHVVLWLSVRDVPGIRFIDGSRFLPP